MAPADVCAPAVDRRGLASTSASAVLGRTFCLSIRTIQTVSLVAVEDVFGVHIIDGTINANQVVVAT